MTPQGGMIYQPYFSVAAQYHSPQVYAAPDVVPVAVLDGCAVEIGRLFEE